MKLNWTGQADVGVSFRLFSLSLSRRWEGVCDGLVSAVSQMRRLIYRVYIRQLLCTSAYYFPMPLSGYDRDRRHSR